MRSWRRRVALEEGGEGASRASAKSTKPLCDATTVSGAPAALATLAPTREAHVSAGRVSSGTLDCSASAAVVCDPYSGVVSNDSEASQ